MRPSQLIAAPVVLALIALSATAGSPLLFVLNKVEGKVTIVEARTGEVAARLDVGEGPHEAAISPDESRVVVCNYGARTPGNSLDVIDVAARKIAKRIELEPYHRPHGIMFLPDGERVVVTAEQERKLLIVNVTTGEIESAIDTDQDISHMVALTPDARAAFVANIRSGSVSVIDLETEKLVKVIETGAGAEGVAVHPTRPEAWVTNRAAYTLSVIDTKTLEVIETLDCGEFPIRVAITPDGRHALVSCAVSGDVAVFDVAARKEIRRLAMDAEAIENAKGRLFNAPQFEGSPTPVGILIEPDGSRAYVANTNADVVTIIDLSEWSIIGRLSAGKEPDGLAFAGDPGD